MSLKVQTRSAVGILFALAMTPIAWGNHHCKEGLYTGQDKRLGKPAVVGKTFVVPELRMRFSDLETGEPVTPERVEARYLWLPYESPPGNSLGPNREDIICTPSGGKVVIPSYKVRPRVWEKYPGHFWPWAKPKFDYIEMIVDAGYIRRALPIRKNEVKRFSGKTLHVKIPRRGLMEYWLEAPDGSILQVKRRVAGGLSFTSPEENQARRLRWQQNAFVPSPTSLEREAGCKRVVEATEATKGEALVKGKSYVVPELRLRLSDLKAGDPIIPEKVSVGYYWWDHVELIEGEDYECEPGEDVFVIPSYEVRPRTWERYRGSSLPWNKPRFLWFQMAFYDHRMKSPALLQIPRNDINRFRGGTLHAKIPLDVPSHRMDVLTQFWLEAPDGSMLRVEHGVNELIFNPISSDSGESTPKHKN